jgi:hypothetical protein
MPFDGTGEYRSVKRIIDSRAFRKAKDVKKFRLSGFSSVIQENTRISS